MTCVAHTLPLGKAKMQISGAGRSDVNKFHFKNEA
ncbi:hypothetical protein SAMN05216208_0175 [Roseovarius nanhaiticus]|nr:hypothetical protein SAMN05216208_0175 [Roseovarius nanhaiticus]